MIIQQLEVRVIQILFITTFVTARPKKRAKKYETKGQNMCATEYTSLKLVAKHSHL